VVFLFFFFLGAKQLERMTPVKFQIFLTILTIFSNFLLFNIKKIIKKNWLVEKL